MHGTTEAQSDRGFKAVLEAADLVVPDGMPLGLDGPLQRISLEAPCFTDRKLMLAFCEATASWGCKHFLYGGRPGSGRAIGRDHPDALPRF